MQSSNSFYKILWSASEDNAPTPNASSGIGAAARLWKEIRKQAQVEDFEKSSDLAFCQRVWSCAGAISDLRTSVADKLKLLFTDNTACASSSDLESLEILPESHLFKAILLIISDHSQPAKQGAEWSPEQIAKSLLRLFAERFGSPVSVPVDEVFEAELISVLSPLTWRRLAKCTAEIGERELLAQKIYSRAGNWEDLLHFKLSSESAEALVARYDIWMLESILLEFSSTLYGDSAAAEILSALMREGRFDDCEALIAKLPENRLEDDFWLSLVKCAAEKDEPQRAAAYSQNICSPFPAAMARATSILHDTLRGREHASYIDELPRLLDVIQPTEDTSRTQAVPDPFASEATSADARALSRLVSDAQVELTIRLARGADFGGALKTVESIAPDRKRYAAFFYLCQEFEAQPYARLDNALLNRLSAVAIHFRGGDYYNQGVDIFLESLARMKVPTCHAHAIELAIRLDRPSMELDGTSRLLDWFYENRALAEAKQQNWTGVQGPLEMVQDPGRRAKAAADAAVLAMAEEDWNTADMLLRMAGESGSALQGLRQSLADAASKDGACGEVLRGIFLGAIREASAYLLTGKPSLAVLSVIHLLMHHSPFEGRLDVLHAALDVVGQKAWSRQGDCQISEFETLIQPFLTDAESKEIGPRIVAVRREAGAFAPSPPPPVLTEEIPPTVFERWTRTIQPANDLSPTEDQVLCRWIESCCCHAVRNPAACDILSGLVEAADTIEHAATKERVLHSISDARAKASSAAAGVPPVDDHESNPNQSGSAAISDFEAALESAASAEFGWRRVLDATELAKRCLSHGDLSCREASLRFAVQTVTEFLSHIFAKGEAPGIIMDVLSSLAHQIASALDRSLAAQMLNSLLQKVVVFPPEISDLGMMGIGVAFAKIGNSKRAIEIAEQIESAQERCECLGKIAAELGDGNGVRSDEAALGRFNQATLELVSRFPSIQGVDRAICNAMREFAAKRHLEGVKAALSLLMRYVSNDGETGLAGECFATIASSLDRVGLVPLLEATTRELLSAGLLDSHNLETAFKRLIRGRDALTHATTAVALVKCLESHLPGAGNANQSSILKNCVLLFLKRFPSEADGIRLIAEIASSEAAFDFLCDGPFWRHFDDFTPDARRKVIRKAGALCPLRQDVARWILSETAASYLQDGHIQQASDVATLLNRADENVVLTKLRYN
jgi:hypothetical protein